MKRASALMLLMMIALFVPVNAIAQEVEETPSPDVAGESSLLEETEEIEPEPTEKFRFVAVGLMFLMLFIVGVAYMRSVMKGAENK